MENRANEAVVQNATEFTVGSVLSRTMSVLLKKPILFIVLTLIGLIPATIIVGLLMLSALKSESPGMVIFFGLLGAIISWILALILQAAVAYGVFKVLHGENAGFGSALGRGFASAGTLLPLSIIVGICVGVGYLLLIIPGIIISCILAVVVPVCVVEKRGVFECMGRSAELTKGNRLKVFAVFFIVGLVILIINKLIMPAIVIALPGSLMTAIISIILLVIPQTYQSVMTSIIYYDLRAVKEGVSVDALAKVFD